MLVCHYSALVLLDVVTRGLKCVVLLVLCAPVLWLVRSIYLGAALLVRRTRARARERMPCAGYPDIVLCVLLLKRR